MSNKIAAALLLFVLLNFYQFTYGKVADGYDAPAMSERTARNRIARKRQRVRQRRRSQPAQRSSAPPTARQPRARPVLDGQPAEEAPEVPDYIYGDPRANQPRVYKPRVRRDRPKRDNP